MERVSDHSPYSSDEWEDSESDGDHSDTDDDHSDSSDDDDPKSQVDRLIERGTLMYMDDENSALSSESESDSDYDDDDSESDITDVSPLISATASPVGLSPVLPRRTISTSPLALHPRPLEHNTSDDLAVVHDNHHKQWNGLHDNNIDHHTTDSTNMALLVQAVMELEKKVTKKRPKHRQYIGLPHSTIGDNNSTSVQGIHPIHDSPHHRHLIRKSSSSSRRKNMSFTNEEVRRIDRDNKILLKKIMAAHSKSRSHSNHQHHQSNHHHTLTNGHYNHHSSQSHHTNNFHSHNHSRPHNHQRPANATINRKKEDEKIRRENLILLRKIQEAKPSKEVVESRSPRHRYSSSNLRSPHNSISTVGSCSLSARAMAPVNHVTTQPPRKETAL